MSGCRHNRYYECFHCRNDREAQEGEIDRLERLNRARANSLRLDLAEGTIPVRTKVVEVTRVVREEPEYEPLTKGEAKAVVAVGIGYGLFKLGKAIAKSSKKGR